VSDLIAQPVRQACILVGGKGTRLGEVTRTAPKPLVEIRGDTVFLDIVIDQLARQGFDDIVLLAGYLGELVHARYDGRSFGGARLRVVVEPEPLGTAGALVAARGIIAPRFAMLNGDTFFDIDLQALCAGGDAGCEALIALHQVSDASRYGSVVLDGSRVVRFVEKRQAAGAGLINAGVYVLGADILDRIRALPCSMETGVFPALAQQRKLCGRVCEGYFIDIGLPETLQQARRELAALAPRTGEFGGVESALLERLE
jgi:D-glycero-D-manno-heptose 1,7-bisphosphate phosphatase